MKRILFFFIIFCLIQRGASFAQEKTVIEIKDNPRQRQQTDKEWVQDPKTGLVPLDELVKAHAALKERFKTEPNLAISGIDWKERGPNNIGGRTRALMFDPNDVTKKKVWAGGVAGGLWYNNDITNSSSSWTNINDFWSNLAITCIAYNPSNTQIMYVGTGEGWYNSDAVQGGGIWKTTDGGASWNLLNSTIPSFSAGLNVQQYAFQTIQKIVVANNGDVFAATQYGVWKSTDDGVSWSLSKYTDTGYGEGQNFCSDLEYVNGILYAAFGRENGTSIHKSSNNGYNWTNITPNYVTGGRTELAVGNSNTIYVVCDKGYSTISYFKKSYDGGYSWSDLSIPTESSLTTDVTNGQAWYDLTLAVHPFYDNLVYIGGASFARSLDGGSSWYCFPYWNNVHPDHHAMVFKPNNPSEMIMGNDGGVYYSSNFGSRYTSAGNASFAARNLNFNVTQPYAVAVKNLSNDGYVLTGLQDNGTIKLTGGVESISSGTQVLGGDGMLCHIDQDNPGYQFATYQYNKYKLLDADGNILKDLTPHYGGKFVNPSAYDSQNNILYSYEGYYGRTDIARYEISGTSNYIYTYLSMLGRIDVSVLKTGIVSNTLFVGTTDGYVYKLTQINSTIGNYPNVTTVFSPSQSASTGRVSCIEIGENENELIVIQSNYGVKSVFYSNDGGSTWTSKDESSHGLPNIPIRYALFNPNNRKQVLLATELGVWSTRDITASNPGWQPTNANLANVRCEMLKYRSADKTFIVATHGRGIFTTKIVTCVTPNSPVLSSASVLIGNSATLTASGCSGIVNWYSSFSSSNVLASGNSFITPNLTQNTTYYADCQVETCVSTRAYTTVVIRAAEPTLKIYASSDIINEGDAVTLQANLSNYSGSLLFMWFLNGTLLTQGYDLTSFSSTKLNQGDRIVCKVMINGAALVSNLINFTVKQPFIQPKLVLGGSGCRGYSINLESNGTTKIKWKRNGVEIQNPLQGHLGKATWTLGATPSGSQLKENQAVFVDRFSNVYVSDTKNHRVLKFAPGSTIGEVVAGGNGRGSDANQLNIPVGIFVDLGGNVYVADEYNHRIQKWTPGAISGITVAGGNGNGSGANQLKYPLGVFVDLDGNIFVADTDNQRVQKWIEGANTGVTVAAGNGMGAALNQVNSPRGIYVDTNGNIYIADANNSRVLKWIPGATSGIIVAGGNGNGAATNQLSYPSGVYVDLNGAIYVADRWNNRIQKWVSGAILAVTVAGGNGAGSNSNQLNWANGVYVDVNGDIYIADETNNRVQKWFSGATSGITVAGGNRPASNQFNVPISVNVDANKNVYVADYLNNRVQKWSYGATSGSTIINAGCPSGIFVDRNGNIFVSNDCSDLVAKWTIGASSGVIVAGGNGYAGSGTNQFSGPRGIHVDVNGNLYVADYYNHRIQKWSLGATSGITVAGGNGKGSAANQLNYPNSVSVDGIGNVYVVDSDNHRIQKWLPGATSGVTVAGGNGSGSAANQLSNPRGVYIDLIGNIYIADYGNNRIQKWSPGATTGTTVVGGTARGNAIDRLDSPTDLFIDNTGSIYVADFSNNRVAVFESNNNPILIPSSTGTYTAEVTTSYGTFVTNSINLTQLDVLCPSIEISSSTNNINPGTSVTFTASVVNNSFTPVYQWKVNGLVVGGNTRTFVSTTLKDGDKVMCTITNFTLNGVATSIYSNVLSMQVKPTFIQPNLTLDGGACVGGTLTLQSNPTTNIVWKKNGQVLNNPLENNIGDAIRTIGAVGLSNQLNKPKGVFLDKMGNLYVADAANHRIQKWTSGATSGVTVAGGNGKGNAPNQLNNPSSVFVDADANVYIADMNNHRIQKWSPGASIGVTVAGGNGDGDVANQLSYPSGIYIDRSDNIYIADSYNHRIQKWSSAATYGVTVAGGNGYGSAANQLYYPSGLYVDNSENIYIADTYNYRIQKWLPRATSGVTVAGGPNQLTFPGGLYVDNSENIYIADIYHRIQKWLPGATSGVTVAGGNGYGSAANQLYYPGGLYVDNSENIYIADMNNHRIQKWSPGATSGVTVAGGSSAANQLSYPSGIYIDRSDNIYIADMNNHRIQKWSSGATSGVTVAGGNGYGSAANQLYYPGDLYVDGSGNIYIADNGNSRIQKWSPGARSGVTVAGGNGYGSAANQLDYPSGLYVDNSENIYIADTYNNRIQKWSPGARSGETVAGGNGAGSATNQLYYPEGLYVDGSGNIYVADRNNYRIQKWSAGATSGVTIAGGNDWGNDNNQLNFPSGVFVDKDAKVYVADAGNNRIAVFNPNNNTQLKNVGVGVYTATISNVYGTLTSNAVTVIDKPNKPLVSEANIAICEGESVQLSASGCTNYEWGLGQTTASLTVNPLATTTYSVKCKIGANCYSDASLIGVQVGGLSNVSVLTGLAAANKISRAGKIQSTQIVNPTVNHTYKVAKSVELLPGFKADGTSIFQAEVDGRCGN